MSDENLIATLEESLRLTRNSQNRLMARLREAETEVDLLRQEIDAFEKSAAHTESTIDRLLVAMHAGSARRGAPRAMVIDDEYGIASDDRQRAPAAPSHAGGSIAYMSQHRGVPSKTNNIEAITQRFSDRTIIQACTLVLRESGKPLHVNELYNLLVAGGLTFKGNNPTISIAVSLSRSNRFRKVEPGTFDLVMREASRVAS